MSIPNEGTSTITQTAGFAAMYASRIRRRFISFENPARDSHAKKKGMEKRSKRQRQRERKVIGTVGRKSAKEWGIGHLDNSQAKFDNFLPLHYLWLDYMSELLSLPLLPGVSSTPNDVPASGMQAMLIKADFHGSIISVRCSKNTNLLGLSGIVINETENGFGIITPHDEVKFIPKQNSVFTFAVPIYSTIGSISRRTILMESHLEFELYGNQLLFCATERAGRKFKHKKTIQL